MKKTTQITLAAVALATLLGTAGCAGNTPAETPSGVPGPAEVTNTVKADGFDEKIAVNDILPADWEFSSGWRAVTGETENNVFAVGDYLAYLEGKQLQTDGDTEIDGRLIFVDGKGNKTYPAKDMSSSTVSGSSLRPVSADGKTYLVYAETFTKKGDPTSMSKSSSDESASLVTVFDEAGKELYSKEIDGWINFRSGDTIGAESLTGPSLTFDVVTGETSPKPELAGHGWVGNYDGVDVFVSDSSPTVLTDGKWTIPASGATRDNSKISPFGNAIAVSDAGSCGVFDPHTGKNIDPELTSNNLCGFGTIWVTSPDGNVVSYGNKLFSLKEKSVVKISNDVNFTPKSISSNGDVYGVGSDKVGVMNVLKGGDPVGLPGATVAPLVVSGSGLAAFKDYKDENSTLFMVRK